jgi:hypothetical protein
VEGTVIHLIAPTSLLWLARLGKAAMSTCAWTMGAWDVGVASTIQDL